MVSGKTCSACRSRKVRCDGMEPTCGPCSKARRQMECVYISAVSSSPTQKGPLLQKGAACYACRRKKKKCDAIRPFCTTCKIAGKEHDCQYEDNVERSLTEALIAHSRNLEQRLAVYESQAASRSASTSREEVVEASAPAIELSDTLSDFLPPFAAPFIRGTSLSDIPSFFINQSPSRPSALRNDTNPLSINHHHIAAPLPNGDDFRALFLSHHGQLGVCLSQAKLEAIMVGDLSSTTVHPVLVHAAQLLGFRLWQEKTRTVYNPGIEEGQLSLIKQALLNTVDPVTRLQVHCMLAFYFLLRQFMQEGHEQLVQAVRTVTENNMTFNIQTEAPLQELSSQAKEQICALCQLMYLEKAANLVLNDPPMLTVQYEHEFRAVPYLFANLSKNNLVILRTRSVSLLHQTRAISAQWTELIVNPQYTSSNTQDQWYTDYWNLMEEVSEHISSLNTSMLKATFFHHREHGLVLKLCLIITLTASAELHRLLANNHIESRLKCLDMVFEIVGISRSLQDDDYIFLDPVLGICWSMVASVLKEEHAFAMDQFSLVHFKRLFHVLTTSASKLHRTLPYVDGSLERISAIASDIEELP
ncbi:hypothetical protein B0H21DRAFT_718585 [Amylocystis lapponica]|nr:hypothetical protein B0H21DRAFT_718585 [Amylocystis lapponica]